MSDIPADVRAHIQAFIAHARMPDQQRIADLERTHARNQQRIADLEYLLVRARRAETALLAQLAERTAQIDRLQVWLDLVEGRTTIRQLAEARGVTPAALKEELYARS